jgi:hypothetical protein
MLRRLGLKVDKPTLAAMEFLESRGYSFCGHFGTDNAVTIAANVMALELCNLPRLAYPHDWAGPEASL